MSTSFHTDSRLSQLFDNTESLIEVLVKVLSENYDAGKLSIGNNSAKEFDKREVYYTVVDSEFENVFLTLTYRNSENFGSKFEIKLETFNSDYPTELKIQINSDVTDKLPKEMMENLFERLHDFENDYF